MLATSHDWGYSDERWTWERARVIGGCSSHNGAIAAVGHRSDYDGWGLPGWRAEDVLPFFASVIDRMRVRAYERDEAVPFHAECLTAAEALGWTIASDLCDLDANQSFGLETVNIVGSTRWNAAFAYLDPVREGTGLRILDLTTVDSFTSSPSGLVTITGLRGQAGAAEPVTITAGTLVLSGGTYSTPAILQRSGVGDPSMLQSVGIQPVVDLPGVGANLHDHPMVNVQRAVGPELQAHLDAVAATGYLPEEQTLGKFTSDSSEDRLFDAHVFPVCASDQTSMLHGRVAVEVACMTPRSRGSVRIASPDPLAAPVIDHAYLSDAEGHDLAVLRHGLGVATELLAYPAVDRLLGAIVETSATDDEIRARVAHYYHPVGTCAMGDTPMSVTDARGRVHGLDNVVVADASLFPVIPRANTNIPTIMVGERIASTL
jgi:choline dehydrogenase